MIKTNYNQKRNSVPSKKNLYKKSRDYINEKKKCSIITTKAESEA